MMMFALTWFMVGLITNLIGVLVTGKVHRFPIFIVFCLGFFAPIFILNYIGIKGMFKH